MVAVGVRDKKIADGGEIDARPQPVIEGVGREIDAKFAVHKDLRARAHRLAAAQPDGAAEVTIAKERGDALRRARPEKLDVHRFYENLAVV